jgi:hypothetical protein
MKLCSVLERMKGDAEVSIFDYLSHKCYASTDVAAIINHDLYHQKYRECTVYSINVNPFSATLEVSILLD